MGVRLNRTSISIADADSRLEQIEQLMLKGLVSDAWTLATAIGHLSDFAGPRAQCTAAWIADHVGADELARRWYVKASRDFPGHATTQYYAVSLTLRERGPLAAWLQLRNYEPPPGTSSSDGAEIQALRASILAYLQDHREAQRELDSIDEQVLGHDRKAAVQSLLHIQEGNFDQALDGALSALAKGEPCRLLVQEAISLLESRNRRVEALELAKSYEPRMQSATLCLQRAGIEHELELFDDERQTLNRCEQLWFMPGPLARQTLRVRRAENAYRRGELKEFRALAGGSKVPWFEACVKTIGDHEGPPDRRQIDVPIVIQEPMGCAPSSLAILSAHFGSPVDHVDVADQICYEGTASHSERRWVQSRGWVSREFTVDFDTSKQLIERGVPFLLVTVAVASAHAQVVVGFDATRRTLMIRDPNSYRVVEANADRLFLRHRAYGPRGHVILPPNRASVIDGLQLPDVALHDIAFRMQLALERHDREGALEQLAQLNREAPERPLTLWAERGLAVYNQDPYAIMACSARILRAFPGDDNAELSIVDCLGSIGSESELVERLEARLAKRDPDSMGQFAFLERRGQLLLADARQHTRAQWMLRRAHRLQPTRGRTITMLAQALPSRDQSGIASSLFRAATTLNPTDDDLAWQYFEHCYKENSTGQALEWLKERFSRYAVRSSQPALVLFRAYEWLDRVNDAFALLEQAQQLRPKDADLKLFAAETHARYCRMQDAAACIEAAREGSQPAAVERVAAVLSELSGDLRGALERQHLVLQSTPLSLRSHEAVANLLFELEGPAKAREHFAKSCRQFPTHVGLKELHVAWLRGHDPSVTLAELDQLLLLQPNHNWAKRERALALLNLGRLDEALAEAKAACDLAPSLAACHAMVSTVLAATGQRTAALAAAKIAAEIWPDSADALGSCVRLAASRPQQMELLEWAEGLALERSVDGSALVDWYQQAIGVLSEPELLTKCEAISHSRPELWVGYHLEGLQSLRLARAEHAINVLQAGVSRFPFIPRLGIDLADAYAAASAWDQERQAAEATLKQNPRWLEAIVRLSNAHLHCADEASALKVLARGLMHHPRSAPLLRSRAAIQWSRGAVEAAFEDLQQAVSAAPSDPDSWYVFHEYASTLNRSQEVVMYAKHLAAQRPHNPYIWLRLAETLRRESENEACLEALNEALKRHPRLSEAIDLAAVTLTSIGRYTEALAMCERPVGAYFTEGALRARRAWVIRQSGDHNGAITAVHELLKDHPDNCWARERLVDWEIQDEHIAEAVQAAKSLVEADPLSAVSYLYLGHAQQQAGKLDLALAAYGKAAELDRSSSFAGRRRIEIAISQEQIHDAEQVIEHQGSQVSPHERDYWTLLVQLAKHDSAGAWGAFERLAQRATTPGELLAYATRKLSELDAKVLVAGFESLFERDVIRDDLGYFWVLALNEVSRRPKLSAINRLAHKHPQVAASAAKATFELLGDEKTSFWRAVWALFRLRALAQPQDDVWGKAGYALVVAHAYVVGQWWLRDYATRSSAEAWMLHNYRVCALENHQFKAAARAVDHALTLPTDETLRRHLAFAAFERATAGNTDAARKILSGIPAADAKGQDLWLFNAATALVELSGKARGRQREIIGEMEAELGLANAKAFGWFTEGILHRRLAGGVLRQCWSVRNIIRRYALAVLAAFVVWLFIANDDLASFARQLGFLLLLYVLRRWKR